MCTGFSGAMIWLLAWAPQAARWVEARIRKHAGLPVWVAATLSAKSAKGVEGRLGIEGGRDGLEPRHGVFPSIVG